jgi:hypothetical protein
MRKRKMENPQNTRNIKILSPGMFKRIFSLSIWQPSWRIGREVTRTRQRPVDHIWMMTPSPKPLANPTHTGYSKEMGRKIM